MIGWRAYGATLHTVQLALAGGAACRPAGPTLGTGVPAEGWTLVALLHSSADQWPALAGNGHWSADQKSARCPSFAPNRLQNDSKLCQGASKQ